MPHADLRRARIGRAAARRGRGAARSGEAQVRRKRQREIQEARGILIPISHRSHRGTEGEENKEKGRQGDNVFFYFSPCLTLSLSPCLDRKSTRLNSSH